MVGPRLECLSAAIDLHAAEWIAINILMKIQACSGNNYPTPRVSMCMK